MVDSREWVVSVAVRQCRDDTSTLLVPLVIASGRQKRDRDRDRDLAVGRHRTNNVDTYAHLLVSLLQTRWIVSSCLDNLDEQQS